MHAGTAPDHAIKASAMSEASPVVFVVDDDISVREALELLIRFAGWQPETFELGSEVFVSTARSRPKLPDSRRCASGAQWS